jgi:hypothetical protein
VAGHHFLVAHHHFLVAGHHSAVAHDYFLVTGHHFLVARHHFLVAGHHFLVVRDQKVVAGKPHADGVVHPHCGSASRHHMAYPLHLEARRQHMDRLQRPIGKDPRRRRFDCPGTPTIKPESSLMGRDTAL